MQPFNYIANVQSPIQKVIEAQAAKLSQQNLDRGHEFAVRQQDHVEAQAVKDNEYRQQTLGVSQRQIDLQESEAQRQIKAAQEKQQALTDFSNLKNKTPQDYADMITRHPDVAKDIQAGYELLNKSAQMETQKEAAQVYSAISSGNVDVAKTLLETRLEAAENSGDKKSAAGSKAMLSILKQNPEAAKTSMGLFLASVSDDFSGTLTAIDNHHNKRELLPGEIRKQNAELASQGLKEGLTRAQINKTMVETKNLSVAGRKAVLEVEALGKGGGVVNDPEKRFNMEQKLRKEYNTEVSTFTETQDAFERVNSAENTAVGDIALITSYMKMIDPGSVVREGEFATAQNAAGAPEKFRNTFNKIMSGERLTPGQRKEFKSQAKSLLGAAKKREQDVRAGLNPTIKRYGLDSKNVFYTPETDEQTQAESTSAASPQFRFNAATGELEAVGG